MRKLTKKISMGGIAIGGGEQITVQSMTNTKTEDVEATVAQILRMQKAGCDIVRVADIDDVAGYSAGKRQVRASRVLNPR